MGVLLGRFSRYLTEERGLSPSTTVPHYIDVARECFGALLVPGAKRT